MNASRRLSGPSRGNGAVAAPCHDVPWYVFIGPPGSGKTTALLNSGLKFPVEQRSGRGALRGVGGTRNCDWWFTDDAVFLDTAGRYLTQDSDERADSAGWAEFLGLLRKYRTRRPLNGVILTISAHDLLTQSHYEREAYLAAARRRLDELNRELRIPLPVYVMVTKCDLVLGFNEYFDDLGQEARTQVWGTTFAFEDTTKGLAASRFADEFDALMTRLNERLFGRLENERDERRRVKMFAFPQQMASLKEALVESVDRDLRIDQVREADPASGRLLHERHAGRHAHRSAARFDRPTVRGDARCGGAAGPRQGVLRRAAAARCPVQRIGPGRPQLAPRGTQGGRAAGPVRRPGVGCGARRHPADGQLSAQRRLRRRGGHRGRPAAGIAGAGAGRGARVAVASIGRAAGGHQNGTAVLGRHARRDAVGAVSGERARQRGGGRLRPRVGRCPAAGGRGAHQETPDRVRGGAREALRVPQGVPDARRHQSARQTAADCHRGPRVEDRQSRVGGGALGALCRAH